MSAETVEAAIGLSYLLKWLLGIVSAASLGILGWFSRRIDMLEIKQISHEIEAAAKISSIQAKLEDIPYIRDRVDEVINYLRDKKR